MATNYWRSDDVVQIGEKKVEIASENGLSYSGGGKISLFVPPSVKYMSGKDSFLEFNVKLKLPAGGNLTRLQLDQAGAGTLFRNLRIYDGTRGNLLEEIVDYANLVILKYDYDADDSLRNKRAMEEGGTAYSQANRGTEGTSKSDLANTMTNPYVKKISGDQTTDFSDSDFVEAKCCVPIHSGIFSGSIFPVMMSSGLYLEFDLHEAPRVVKQLDTVKKDRRLRANPFFWAVTLSGAAGTWQPDDVAITVFYISQVNNISGEDMIAKCPFVVGEKIKFIKKDGTDDSTVPEMTIEALESAGVVGTTKKIKVTINATANPSADGVGIDNDYVLYSTSVTAGAYAPTMTISDFKLVVHQVVLDPKFESGMLAKAREGKAVEFDINTVTTYKNSLLASDTQTTFHIHANNSRAKSLIVQPTDSTAYTSGQLIGSHDQYIITEDAMDHKLRSSRGGLVGICDGLSSYQMQIDGVLVPSRPVSTKKIATRESIDAFHLFELEKGLDNADITPRSFREFMGNFVVSRGFAIGSGAMDLRGKDLAVNLRYEDQPAGVTAKNKMVNSYVFHVRRLMLRGNGAVEVIV